MSGTLPSGSDDPDESERSTADSVETAEGFDPAGASDVDEAARADSPEDGGSATAGTADTADTPDSERTETDGTPAAEAGPDGTDGDGGVRVCWLDDEDADDLIGALAPQTARDILSAVHEDPRTASELADTADTSVQNVRHHVSKLVDAGLVEAVDSRYSVKGREMTVYGPADDRVVVAVGGESERSSLLDSLGGLSGAAAVLAGASLLVQALFGAGVASLSGPETAPRVGDAVTTTGGAVLGTLPPGVAFLAGGLLVLATVLAIDRLRYRSG